MAYNLFAQQKQQNYPNAQTAQQVNPGQGNAGETPEQFAAGKQAANSQTAGYNAQPVQQTQQAAQQTQAQLQTTPAGKPQATLTLPTIDPNSDTSGMEALAQMYTSPQDEERMRRASVANQRIMAVADALRHIGNIYNTVNYAPAQQLNSPVLEEQARYERGKALRDKANLTYLNYQQAKAAQDAKARQWEATFNYNAAKDAANAAALADYRDRTIKERGRIADQNYRLNVRRADDAKARGEAAQKERERHNRVAERQGQQRIGIASQNARNMQSYRQWKMNGGGGSGGGGVAPLDTPKGRITPNGKNYSNQLLQMFDYAKSQGLVQESDVAKRLRELGFGKDQSDNVKRQMVMDLLRTNPTMGDYAADRLGWSYGGGTMDLGLEDDEDEMDLGLE